MEFLSNLFDPMTLGQGIVASVACWGLYHVGKRLIDFALKVGSRFNRRVKLELLVAKLFHHAHGAAADPARFYVQSIYFAFNRTLHGLTYVLIAEVSSPFIGPIANVAYVMAAGFFFLALRYVHVNFGPSLTAEEHEIELGRVELEMKGLLPGLKNPKKDGALGEGYGP